MVLRREAIASVKGTSRADTQQLLLLVNSKAAEDRGEVGSKGTYLCRSQSKNFSAQSSGGKSGQEDYTGRAGGAGGGGGGESGRGGDARSNSVSSIFNVRVRNPRGSVKSDSGLRGSTGAGPHGPQGGAQGGSGAVSFHGQLPPVFPSLSGAHRVSFDYGLESEYPDDTASQSNPQNAQNAQNNPSISNNSSNSGTSYFGLNTNTSNLGHNNLNLGHNNLGYNNSNSGLSGLNNPSIMRQLTPRDGTGAGNGSLGNSNSALNLVGWLTPREAQVSDINLMDWVHVTIVFYFVSFVYFFFSFFFFFLFPSCTPSSPFSSIISFSSSSSSPFPLAVVITAIMTVTKCSEYGMVNPSGD